MPQFDFSGAFKAKVREQIRPLSFKVLREVADSPDILVEEWRCLKCGFSKKLDPPMRTKATGIHDCEWTHEFNWDTGTNCDGQVAFVTSSVEDNNEKASSLLRFVPAGLNAR